MDEIVTNLAEMPKTYASCMIVVSAFSSKCPGPRRPGRSYLYIA
jgi:hypothetical protein